MKEWKDFDAPYRKRINCISHLDSYANHKIASEMEGHIFLAVIPVLETNLSCMPNFEIRNFLYVNLNRRCRNVYVPKTRITAKTNKMLVEKTLHIPYMLQFTGNKASTNLYTNVKVYNFNRPGVDIFLTLSMETPIIQK